jgi:hypothetical protein
VTHLAAQRVIAGQRRLLSAMVVLLLLFMQQDANWHALRHDRQWFDHARDFGLHVPTVAKPCALCALLAGGANALTGAAAVPVRVAASMWLVSFAFQSQPAAQPSYYSSRAPPLAV